MTVEEIRGDCEDFPVGMRVLAVDDDPICLMFMEKLLRKCQYHVTTTSQATMALKMLREDKHRFDLVISDVHMPDMDGFKLLEHVGLEMDLPVIMLSANADPKLVLKGVTHGACDYLVKPVRKEELMNIWQHVIRRKRIDPKNQNKSNGRAKSREESGDGQESPLTGNADHSGKFNRKRKDEEYESEDNGNESEDPGTQKKPRVVWSIELHRKFVGAVNQLGIDKAVPKRILDLMNVDGLTRENVASHLQKYRLYLKRISAAATQQANMAAAFGVRDSPFMHMCSLDGGLGDYRTLTGPRLSSVTLSPFTSTGVLGQLNSPANVNLRNLTPSPLVQLNQAQNSTNPISSIGQMHLVRPFANQSPNLFRGNQPSSGLENKGPPHFNSVIGNSGIFSNVETFSDLDAAIGSSRNLLSNGSPQQQVLNGGGFGNQSTHGMANFSSSNLLDPGKCSDSWRNTVESSKVYPNSPLLSIEGFHNNNISSDGTYFQNNLIDLSSDISLVTAERRRDNTHGSNNNDNNIFSSLNCFMSPLGRSLDQNSGILNQKMDMFVNGKMSGSGSTLMENGKSGMGLRARFNEDILMEQPKLQGGFGRSYYDSLDELMNAMIKREQDEIMPHCDFGLDDDYSFGQVM
ncbi:hypothetical protein OROHE_022632 [Orobanche hederae]